MSNNLFLYLGAFLVATGIGMPIGAVFLLYWAVRYLGDKSCGTKIHYGTEFTQNNYDINDCSNNNSAGGDIPKKEYISRETLEENR